MKRIFILLTLSGSMTIFSGSSAQAQDGEQTFTQNCSACHKMGMRLVGPDLSGITDRRSEEWIASFVRNSTAMIADGDADAVAIFEEFNKMPMTAFDLSDDEMAGLISYLGGFGGSTEAPAAEVEKAPAAEVAPTTYSDEEIADGRAYFQGGKRFSGGGTSCVVCHNVNNSEVIPGGMLAKDLTNVYGRMGDAGLAGILGAPPFPAMTNAYSGGAALTDEEIHALAAFFANADEVSAEQEASNGGMLLLGGGIVGLIIILIIVALLWAGRMKGSVKESILNRQLRSI